jgi:hypothetical protein
LRLHISGIGFRYCLEIRFTAEYNGTSFRYFDLTRENKQLIAE